MAGRCLQRGTAFAKTVGTKIVLARGCFYFLELESSMCRPSLGHGRMHPRTSLNVNLLIQEASARYSES